MNDVRPDSLNRSFEQCLSVRGPDNPERKPRFLPNRPAFDVVAFELELVDMGAVLAKQENLVVDDGVLTARLSRAVPVVDDEDS